MCSLLIGSSPRKDDVDEVAFPIDEGLDRETHLFLGQAAHFEQPRLQMFQFLLKVPSVSFHLVPCCVDSYPIIRTCP